MGLCVAVKLVLGLFGLGARLIAARLRMQRLQVLALGVQAVAQQGADGRVLRLVKGVDGAVHVGQIGLQGQGVRLQQGGLPGRGPLLGVVKGGQGGGC